MFSRVRSKAKGLGRRTFLEALIVFSGALLLFPLTKLSSFLLERKSGPTSYPRVRIAHISDVPLGESFLFTYPHQYRPAMLLHLEPGTYQRGNHWEGSEEFELETDSFAGFDVTCTHLGCQVGWIKGERKMGPSCHGARFSPIDGTVLGGPPPRPQPKIQLEIDENGEIFANGYESGLPLYGEG